MIDREVTLKIGNILSINNEDYRIIATGNKTTVILLNSSLLKLSFYDSQLLYNDIISSKICIKDEDTTSSIIDISTMNESILESFKKDKEVCELIRAHFAPTYEGLVRNRKDPFISNIRKEYGYTKPSLAKKLRRYFQSGFDETSLVDKRHFRYMDSTYAAEKGKLKINKTVSQRITSEDDKNMNEYMNFYISRKYTRVTDAYQDMLNSKYRYKKINEDGSITFGALKENAPSIWQFRRYINSRLTPQKKDAIVMKKHEIRNNKRLLLGSASTGISYPGECVEIDEVDMPISLVSRYDATQTVGRANVYMMIDVLTHVILCVGIAYNQNSYIGLTNMFINMADDKVEYCKLYGLGIQPEDWPSGIIPARMRCDQGSDFKSSGIYQVCQKLGIERNLEPVATGSMKSLIENSFRLIQQQQRSLFEGYGLITKDWGSKHHKEAMLNIDDFTKTLLLLIVEHNKKSMHNFHLSPEQIELGIKPRPIELWKYYCEHVQAPLPIVNKDQYLISLMKTGTAYYDKKGIHFLKRSYIADIKEIPDLYAAMYENQSKRTSIEIKYDPRNMNYIYLIINSKLIPLGMNPKKQENIGYFNLTEQEIIDLNTKRKKIAKEEEKYNNILSADVRENTKIIINHSYNDILPSEKEMRKARNIEKSNVARSEYSIVDRLSSESIYSNSNQLEEHNKIEAIATIEDKRENYNEESF